MTTTRWGRSVLPAGAMVIALLLSACATGTGGSPGKDTTITDGSAVSGSSGGGTSSSGSPSGQVEPSGGSAPVDERCAAVTDAEIRYARGTVAPPFHYEWTIALTGTKATFTMRGGYSDDPAAAWSKDFDLDRQAVADLCDAAVGFGGDAGDGVGGDHASYSITSQKPDDDAAHLTGDIRSPRDFADYVLAHALPDQVWTEVNAQFQAWSFAQQADTDGKQPIPAVADGDPVAPGDVPDSFCDGTASGRIAYSSKGSERVDQMEILLTFAQGKAFLVITPDFSGPFARWDATWDLDGEQQQKLCGLALSTIQDASAGDPDPRTPGFAIVLTGGGQTVTGDGLDLTGASPPFVAKLWGIAGDDVTAQTFDKWKVWAEQG